MKDKNCELIKDGGSYSNYYCKNNPCTPITGEFLKQLQQEQEQMKYGLGLNENENRRWMTPNYGMPNYGMIKKSIILIF